MELKRLCIYLFYDEDGVVDDYVPYFLREIKKFCSEICVVVNGDLNSSNRKKLADAADELVERENVGFDSGAYKQIIEMYGYDYLKTFDELIICNYTFFGPIHPLEEMFSAMDKKECDFWGIYRHPAQKAKSDGVYEDNEHIQSHFLVYRKTLLNSEHFKNYWDTLKIPTSYYEAIVNHELRNTKYFEDLGFKSATYMDKDKYFNAYPDGNATIYLASKQLIEDRSPFIKRKVFWLDENKFRFEYLFSPVKTLKLINYIEKNTSYDFDLIAKNMLRTKFLKNKTFNNAAFSYIAKRRNSFAYFLNVIKYNILYLITPKNTNAKQKYDMKRKIFNFRF